MPKQATKRQQPAPPPNAAPPFVMITLDRPRKMRFGNNCLYMVEELTGMKIEQAMEAELGMKEMLQILCAALDRDARDAGEAPLTPQRLSDLMDDHGYDFMSLQTLLGEGLSQAFGRPDPNAPGLAVAKPTT